MQSRNNPIQVENRLTLTYSILITFVFVNVYAITILPVSWLINDLIFVIQLFLFSLLIIINLDASLLINFSFPKVNSSFFLLILFLVLMFISSFYVNLDSNLNLKSILKIISYPIQFILFFYSFSAMLLASDRLFEKFLNIWLIFSVFTCVVAVFFNLVGINSSNNFSNSAIAFFVHTNSYSFVFTFAVPILIYKFFSKQISILPFLILLISMLTCLLFTYSRAGYLGVFVSILILTYNKSKSVFFITIVLLAVVISTFFIDFALSKGEGSTVSRSQIMITAYNMMFNSGTERLLWGYGVYENIEVFRSENIMFSIERDEADPHNLILLLGIQFGILCTIALLLLVTFVLIKAMFLLRKLKLQIQKQRISMAIAIVVGIMFQNMLEDIVIYPEYFVMPIFLIFLGYLNSSLIRDTTLIDFEKRN